VSVCHLIRAACPEAKEMKPMPIIKQAKRSSSAEDGVRMCACGKSMFPSFRNRSFSFEYRSFECWACGRRQTHSIDSHHDGGVDLRNPR
jgi:hypothetical protein